MSNALAVTSKNFEQEVLLCETPVLVDFFATWCGPCRALAPAVDQIAQERAGRVKVCKCDVDQAPGVAADYGVMSVPTLILFKQARPVLTLVGARPKDVLLDAIDMAIA